MDFISPEHWTDYELIDSGGLEKLERFGKYILARPEPQAVWKKHLPESEWENLANARYRRQKGADPARTEFSDKGEWQLRPGMPEQWTIDYSQGVLRLKFRLGLTSFGHIGIFPEQAPNWEFIHDFIVGQKAKGREFRVLNLFAYTGAASLAARAAGADVVHVDSVRATVSWAREIMELSGMDGIRWVVEDALKFVKREARRGSRYQGIILDPPAYGRGPEGEKWLLQDGIDEMISCCSSILEPGGSFLLFSLYSMGYSALIADNLVRTHFGMETHTQPAELCIPDRAGRRLPLGTLLKMVC